MLIELLLRDLVARWPVYVICVALAAWLLSREPLPPADEEVDT